MKDKEFQCIVEPLDKMKVFQIDNYLYFKIFNQDNESLIALTIEQAEHLMYEIHKIINKIEGGKNV